MVHITPVPASCHCNVLQTHNLITFEYQCTFDFYIKMLWSKHIYFKLRNVLQKYVGLLFNMYGFCLNIKFCSGSVFHGLDQYPEFQ